MAHINLIPEDDGVNRRNLLQISQDGKAVPSLGLMAAMLTLGEKQFSDSSFQVQLGERSIPVGRDGALWINYTGGAGSYPRYSFADVLAGLHLAMGLGRLRNRQHAVHDRTDGLVVEQGPNALAQLHGDCRLEGEWPAAQGVATDALALAQQQPFTTHLEIETYTWDVLPSGLKVNVGESIAREYEWVLQALGQPAASLRNT